MVKVELVEQYPDLMPGVMFLACSRLAAKLSVNACKKNWDWTHTNNTKSNPPCRGCPVGNQLHANGGMWADVVLRSECVRCSRHGIRIVAKSRECVSCFNRRKEGERGYDRRGNVQKNPVLIKPYRLGIMIDGKPSYRQFPASSNGEAISRATFEVAKVKFHNEQPGLTVWNAKTNSFEYRCRTHKGESGVLYQRVRRGGVVEYTCLDCCPDWTGKPIKAAVVSPTSILPIEVVALTYNADDVPAQFIASVHVCDRCRHYPVRIRRRDKDKSVEALCLLCD